MKAAGRINLLVAVLACCLAGCGSMPGGQKAKSKQTYLLRGDGSAGVSAVEDARPCLSLRVSAPDSSPGFGTTRMAYMSKPLRLDYFAYHEWVDSPARMTAAMMESGLEASHLLGVVVTGSSDVRTDLRLDSEIKALQQDFDPAGSTLLLAIKVGLVDVSSRSLLNSATFTYREPVDSPDPEAGVAAANRAASHFLTDLKGFVAASISRFDCSGGGQPLLQGSIGPSGE